VIGAEAHPEAVSSRNEHELDFPARFTADDFDRVTGREQRRGDTIEHRRSSGPRDAKRFELADVRFDRGLVATRPTGKDEMVHRTRVERRSRGLMRLSGQGSRPAARRASYALRCVYPSESSVASSPWARACSSIHPTV
jgi:hypothetical protein